MGDLPFPECPPAADFADAWRLRNYCTPERHPLRRAALLVAISVLELSLVALLFRFQLPVVQPQQSAMAVIQLQPSQPATPRTEIPLQFVRAIASAPQVAAPEFTIMPDTKPPPEATLPVTMTVITLVNGGAPHGSGIGAGDKLGGGWNGAGSKASACVDAGYLAAISRHVQLYFFYPNVVAQGVVYVHFISNRNGIYQLMEIAKSSGNYTLDNAALMIMRRASPLPPIPDSFHADVMNGILPIGFNAVDMTGVVSRDC